MDRQNAERARSRNTLDALGGSWEPWGRFIRGLLDEQQTLGHDPFGVAWTVQVIAWAMRHPEQAQWWHAYLRERQHALGFEFEPAELDRHNDLAIDRLAERWRIEPMWATAQLAEATQRAADALAAVGSEPDDPGEDAAP